MPEQGKAAMWCGRLLLFTALLAGLVTMHTFGHPMAGHGGYDPLSATARPAAPPRAVAAPSMAAPPMTRAVAQPMRQASAPAGPHRAAQPAGAVGRDAHPASVHLTDALTDARADAAHGAMDPGTVCHAVLSAGAFALLVLLGAGALAGRRETGLLAVLRARLLRGLWPISPPPRHKLLARLSVLRV